MIWFGVSRRERRRFGAPDHVDLRSGAGELRFLRRELSLRLGGDLHELGLLRRELVLGALDRRRHGGLRPRAQRHGGRWRGGRRRRGGVVVLVIVVPETEQPGERIDAARGDAGVGDLDAGAARGLDRHFRGIAAVLADIGQRQRIAGQRPAVGGDMHGAAVGEHADQLLAGHARPVPHAAGVHVHERRAGGRIEADAAALQPQADDAQLSQRHAGNIKIHGVAEHVLAEAGDAVAAPPQHGVGFRRTIAAHDPDRLLRSGLALHLPDQVDQVRIDARFFFAPPIAQEPVELLQRRLVVTAVALERDGDVFVGVDVMQRDGAGVALGDGVLQHARAEEQDQSGEGARIEGACRKPTTFQPRVNNGHWRSRVDVD